MFKCLKRYIKTTACLFTCNLKSLYLHPAFRHVFLTFFFSRTKQNLNIRKGDIYNTKIAKKYFKSYIPQFPLRVSCKKKMAPSGPFLSDWHLFLTFFVLNFHRRHIIHKILYDIFCLIVHNIIC